MLNESKYGFYQSDSDRSRFRLVCHCPMPVRFILTHRVPGAKADQAVEVFVNGTRIYQVTAGASWASTSFTAPAEVIRSGLNSIEIGWPLPEWSDAEWRDQAARRLEAGELPEIVPVFGEIHSFQALPVE